MLVLIFVLVQIAEIWLLIQVGHAIGGWQTLVLLLLDSILGAALVRHQGRQTWRAFRRALDEKRMPAREVADGALILVGGTLLLTPGFLSDLLGLVFLLPPTRAFVRPLLTTFVARRLGVGGLVGRRAPRGRQSSYGDVVEGEIVDGGTDEGPPPSGRRP